MNSYQKLKKENEELKKKIAVLCDSPLSLEAVCIKVEHKLKLEIESAVWDGELSGEYLNQSTKQ